MKHSIVMPVTFETDEHIVEMIYDAFSHEDVPEFIRNIDLRYADMGVTENILLTIMEGVQKEFDVGEPDKAQEWKKVCEQAKKLLEEFE